MSRALKALGCLVLLALAAAAGVTAWAWSSLGRPYGEGEKTLLVEPGTSAGAILAELEERGVIADSRLARAWLIYGAGDPPLHAGEYHFDLPLTARQVLDKMIRGDVLLHRVTVIEGLTLKETARALAEAGFGEEEAFLAAISDPTPIADLDPEAENLEGYLYPETYSFVQGTSEKEIVAALVAAFRTRFDEEVRPLLGDRLARAGGDGPAPPPPASGEAIGDPPEGTAAAPREPGPDTAPRGGRERPAGDDAKTSGTDPASDDEGTAATPADEPRRPDWRDGGRAPSERPLTVRELVTLASIVEKEARIDEERPLIAAVYTNRLAAGMGLYADPTVIYGLELLGRYDGNLTRENLRVDSPYNTYRYAGLPPGPIASPGLGSLKAAAAPADVPYLYFVSRNDGTHVFARTLAEHNRNVERWQKRYWRERWAEERRAKEREKPSPPTD